MLNRSPRVAEKIYRNDGNLPLLDLLPVGGGRALDCGCGAGDNARILRSRGWRVTGITLSAEEQRLAAEHCERVLVTDLEQPLPGDVGSGYDAVVLSHVLEHLVAPEPLLSRIGGLLSSRGVVVVALPNVLFYPIRLRALFGRFEYTPGGIMDATHVRFYTFESGLALLRENGFEVVTALAEGGFPMWKLRRHLPPSLVERIDQEACRRSPGLFGRQSLYLARPSRTTPASSPDRAGDASRA
jgi:SAM-dependent methyltransferase